MRYQYLPPFRAVGVVWASAVLAMLFAAPAAAQFGTAATDGGGPKLDQQQVEHWQFGVIVTATGGPCSGIVSSIPVPIDWPEQRVVITDEDFSPYARVRYRVVAGTVKQMVISIPQLPDGEVARVVVTVEITRNSLLPPDDTSLLVSPKVRKLPKDVRVYLASSPYIESQHAKIKAVAKELSQAGEGQPAWDQVRAIYDWVRENVEYQDQSDQANARDKSPIKGALAALKDKTGDCEELTSLFIAICRASEIPARTVHVPGHCYPEFYLQDDEGKGYWFPCQAAGDDVFGGIPELRPILQKGDNFRTPEAPREAKHYVAEFLTGAGGKPSVRWIRAAVDRPAQ